MAEERGEFFIKRGDNGRVVCKLKKHDGDIEKKGLIVQGIEFRPKVEYNLFIYYNMLDFLLALIMYILVLILCFNYLNYVYVGLISLF